MSELERITADGAPTPTGPFVHAVRVGPLLYTSGQAGRNRETGEMGPIGEQVDQALRNIDEVAVAAPRRLLLLGVSGHQNCRPPSRAPSAKAFTRP